MRIWAGLLILALAGCAAPPPAASPTATPVILNGRVTFAGSTTVQPLVEALAVTYRDLNPAIELEIAAGGSVVGINAVQDGSADIGMSSRNLRPDELRSGMELYQIAIDVLAIVVHPSNPVDAISLEQLRAIYTGGITNWSEVGGLDQPILPVMREVSSGTRGAFDEIALGGAAPLSSADVQVTAGEVEARVASNPAAIGYVGFGNLGSDVKVLAIDGVPPSPETARSGAYKLQRPLLLLRGPLSRPISRSFVDFALSAEGQRIVAADGWVPVSAGQ